MDNQTILHNHHSITYHPIASHKLNILNSHSIHNSHMVKHSIHSSHIRNNMDNRSKDRRAIHR